MLSSSEQHLNFIDFTSSYFDVPRTLLNAIPRSSRSQLCFAQASLFEGIGWVALGTIFGYFLYEDASSLLQDVVAESSLGEFIHNWGHIFELEWREYFTSVPKMERLRLFDFTGEVDSEVGCEMFASCLFRATQLSRSTVASAASATLIFDQRADVARYLEQSVDIEEIAQALAFDDGAKRDIPGVNPSAFLYAGFGQIIPSLENWLDTFERLINAYGGRWASAPALIGTVRQLTHWRFGFIDSKSPFLYECVDRYLDSLGVDENRSRAHFRNRVISLARHWAAVQDTRKESDQLVVSRPSEGEYQVKRLLHDPNAERAATLVKAEVSANSAKGAFGGLERSPGLLTLDYPDLESLNLRANEQRIKRVSIAKIQEERLKYLTDEKRVKSVILLFSDLEGRLHMLDYDKKWLLQNWDSMSFDGKSIRGFKAGRDTDLKLAVDWSAFYWAPADVVGAGKVLVFGDVVDKDGAAHNSDIRGLLKRYAQKVYIDHAYTLNATNKIEGFLFSGIDAERQYNDSRKFDYANAGGYYQSVPSDPLRQFMGNAGDVLRAMGFQNEQDQPESAPSQFEMNYGYSEVLVAADNVQIYKLICREVAKKMGLTASFLPKPVNGVNGSSMRAGLFVSKDRKNLFWDPLGEEKMSEFGWNFVDRLLTHGRELCLLLNPSVNAYRRLDRLSGTANRLRVSATDQSSMIQIPTGNERNAAAEVRCIAPDANPYIVMLALFKTGLSGRISEVDNLRTAERYLPDNIYDALKSFLAAEWTTNLLGEEVKSQYADLKQASADRCPRLLGTSIKTQEVQYHHEIYNQLLWSQF